MNTFIHRLSEICREYLLQEKWLLVPSLRMGHQWLAQAALAGQPMVNIQLFTLSRMAHNVMDFQQKSVPYRYLPELGGIFLVERLWNRKKPSDYFGSLTPSLSLYQNLYQSLRSLRLAGVSPEELQPAHWETQTKANEMRDWLNRYESALKNNLLFDETSVYQEACRLIPETPDFLPQNSLLLIPEDLEFSGWERKFLNSLPQERIIFLSQEEPIPPTAELSPPQTDLDLLRHLSEPSQAPLPFQDGTVSMFHAVGESNEIREVFRRCLAKPIALDQVELLHTDAATYIPLIYELLLSLPIPSLPATFAEGIPVRYSRPGRALRAWIHWIRSGYSQSEFVQILRDGLIRIPNIIEDGFSYYDTAAEFQKIGIGFGRERYASKIQERISALENRLTGETVLAAEEEEAPNPAEKKPIWERRYRQTRLLQSFIAHLLEITPKEDSHPAIIINNSIQFLQTFARCDTEFDEQSRTRILAEFQEMQSWMEESSQELSISIWDWLEAMIDPLTVLGSGPQPGCIHVDHILNGGHSGRRYTFIVGLDDSRFPGAGVQDPILLDHERERLSPELLTAARRQRRKIEQFHRLVNRLQGSLTLSYTSFHIQEDRERFPSSLFLAAFRILSGNRLGDYSSLMQWLGTPVSFAPKSPDAALNENEWWMARMGQSPTGRNSLSAVIQRYPHFNDGVQAIQNRNCDEFTQYDGWVPAAGARLDSGSPNGLVLSASGLETLGQCPLRFFFRYGLDLQPPEELEITPDRWLDPATFGSLMHELFECFIRETISQPRIPTLQADWPRMQQILKQLIQKACEEIPPPNDWTFELQRRQLERCAQVFLKAEAELRRQYTPVAVEAVIGMKSNSDQPENQANPVLIPLPDGAFFRAQGKIDRIDRMGEENSRNFAIWDYKSGGTYKYHQPDPYGQGRVIQHVLYIHLVESVMKQMYSPEAQVTRFGFFFPSEKGKGERLEYTAQELTAGKNILSLLCRIIATGVFLPTNQKDDCTFCDYQAVCRNIQEVTESAQRKLSNPLNVRLQPFKELRKDDIA